MDQEPGRGLAEGPGPAQSYGNPGGAGAGDGGAGHRESMAKILLVALRGWGRHLARSSQLPPSVRSPLCHKQQTPKKINK